MPRPLINYRIVRVHIGFHNIHLAFTDPQGKVISWYKTDSKLIKGLFTTRERTFLLKILFTGPSRRHRRKVINVLRKRFVVFSITEDYQRTYNGCRLPRDKR